MTLPAEPPRHGYSLEPAWEGEGLNFIDPLVMTAPRGETNRLFVVEQAGIVSVIPDLTAPTREVFLDISDRIAGGVAPGESGLLGLAFHPAYESNGSFFVFYSTITNEQLRVHLSRFQVSAEDPNRADRESETILISLQDEAYEHAGGDLHFGPDGYLYVSMGDEGAQNDLLGNSQRIDKDFYSAILRIDVDLRPGNLPPNPHPAVFPGTYLVPADNPWVGATEFNGAPVAPDQVRTELWAVGFRNPWRMSFDPATGDLWAGDVGGIFSEEVNLVVRGGNYGWAFREGPYDGPKASMAPGGFESIPPVLEYPHVGGPYGGQAVIGGVVYRGSRLAQLDGAYVFGDFGSGNIWAMRWDGLQARWEHLTTLPGISAFGRDPRNGDVLVADVSQDRIWRLVYDEVASGTPFPETLAETGAFKDLETLAPEDGILPYELNLPFWSDGADKGRWFSIPNGVDTFTPRLDEPWLFPPGAVWIKHFELRTDTLSPERRRLETRFLVKTTDGVYGITYRWTDPPTNAVLVPEEGMTETFTVRDGESVREQVWRYPSRSECLRCHNAAAGFVLGFNTRQLNRDVAFAHGSGNQLELLESAGYLSESPGPALLLPKLAHTTNELASIEWRVRSWLDANCSFCHRPGGLALGSWDARASTPLEQTGILYGLLDDPQGDPLNRVVMPGSVARSMMHSRITRVDNRRMPPVASSIPDQTFAYLLRLWIVDHLTARPGFEEWQTRMFGSPDVPEADPTADPDEDGVANRVEYLAGGDPLNPLDAWKPTIELVDEGIRLRFTRPAHARSLIEYTDDIFDPTAWRPLEVPENAHFIPARPRDTVIIRPGLQSARFYRVRLLDR